MADIIGVMHVYLDKTKANELATDHAQMLSLLILLCPVCTKIWPT
jgi:hypothetical protein